MNASVCCNLTDIITLFNRIGYSGHFADFSLRMNTFLNAYSIFFSLILNLFFLNSAWQNGCHAETISRLMNIYHNGYDLVNGRVYLSRFCLFVV